METKTLNRYIRKLSKYLDIPKPQKKELLKGIEQEIADFQYNSGDYSYERIVKEFSTPEKTAVHLLMGVPDEEIAKYKSKKKRTRIIAYIIVAIIVVMLALFVLYLASQTEVKVTETIEITSRW